MDSERSNRKRSFVPSGYRGRRLVLKRERKRRMTLLSVGIGVIVLIVGAIWISSSRTSPVKGIFSIFSPASSSQSEDNKADEEMSNKLSFLVVGEGKADEKEQAGELLVIVFDFERDKINGVTFSEDTFVEIPGRGFDKVASAITRGPDVSKTAVGDALGVTIEYMITFKDSEYRSLLAEERYTQIFEKAASSDIPDKEEDRLLEAAKEVGKDRINVVPLPVEPIAVGTDTFYQLKREEVDYLIGVFWGKPKTDEVETVRVLVFNGSGKPGIGGEVAKILMDHDYYVVAIENADSFDHEKTEIIIYEEEGAEDSSKEEQALTLKGVVGVGVIISKDVDKKAADLGVLIGNDYPNGEPLP